MKVKRINYNWRQAGSTLDREGCGEDYDICEVGKSGVVSIEEEEFYGCVSYYVIKENGNDCRIFNPNYVEYIK